MYQRRGIIKQDLIQELYLGGASRITEDSAKVDYDRGVWVCPQERF